MHALNWFMYRLWLKGYTAKGDRLIHSISLFQDTFGNLIHIHSYFFSLLPKSA